MGDFLALLLIHAAALVGAIGLLVGGYFIVTRRFLNGRPY
jgi:hypothetical protein